MDLLGKNTEPPFRKNERVEISEMKVVLISTEHGNERKRNETIVPLSNCNIYLLAVLRSVV